MNGRQLMHHLTENGLKCYLWSDLCCLHWSPESGLKRGNKSEQSGQTRALRLLCQICHGAVRPLSIDNPRLSPLPIPPPVDEILKRLFLFFSLCIFLRTRIVKSVYRLSCGLHNSDRGSDPGGNRRFASSPHCLRPT